MLRTIAAITALFLATIGSSAAPRQPLAELVVVVDAGHGGKDPGAHGLFNGVQVFEAAYVADIAKRLALRVKKDGGVALLTRHDPKSPDPVNSHPSMVLPFAGNADVYTLGGQIVRARTKGMLPRLAIARDAKKKYPKHRIVFISIHFDALPDRGMEGVHLIAPPGDDRRIVELLREEFDKAKRLRKRDGKTFLPVVQSGDRAHGLRNLFILSKRNPIPERVLIELGNFANPIDVWRLRNPATRDVFVDIIARALARFAAASATARK